jgi:REP element-mobilizing transposase RayT
MARPLRIQYPGAWYHVTSRGNERRRIFADDQDCRKFLDIVAESVGSFWVQLHCYVLMGNHFHLLLMTPEGNLQAFMQRLNTAYTVYFNRRHRRSGHLLQGRYKAIVVEADPHLAELSRYLHLNPVRVRTHSRKEIALKREIITNYRWSSFQGYISLRRREPFVTYGLVLSVVGGKDDSRGRRRYREFVLSGIAKDMNISYWEDVRGQAVLGSEEFLSWIWERFVEGKRQERSNGRVFSGLSELSPAVEVRAVARAVAERFGVPAKELIERRSRHRQARRLLLGLCYALRSGSKSLAEIGMELGGVGAAALCRNRIMLEEELEVDRHLARVYQAIFRSFRQ